MNRFDPLVDEPVDLSQFDEAYNSAGAQPVNQTTQEIPDGQYETVIEDVVITRTPRTGNPMVSWRLRIVGPNSEGRALVKNQVITQKTLSILKEDLSRCGVELTRLSELPYRVGDMREREMRILKKTKEGWTDIYFVRAGRKPVTELDDNLPF